MQESKSEAEKTSESLFSSVIDTDMVKDDGEYYFYGQYVVFQAQNTRFRVPVEPLTRGSSLFQTMFTLPKEVGQPDVEGSSPQNPIMLPTGVSAKDFRNFLRALYPTTQIDFLSSITKDQWLSVLRLSTMWYFLELRKIAVSKLTSLATAVEKICMGRQYKVAFWVIQGYEALIKRGKPITDKEAIAMTEQADNGVTRTALALFRIREKLVVRITPIAPVQGEDFSNVDRQKFKLGREDARSEIESVFQKEIHAIHEAEEGYGIIEEIK